VQAHLPVPWVYGSSVPETRRIYIHNGNYPRNTDGCLLIGSTRATDFVGNSVATLERLQAYLNRVGIENIKLCIRSNYSSS